MAGDRKNDKLRAICGGFYQEPSGWNLGMMLMMFQITMCCMRAGPV